MPLSRAQDSLSGRLYNLTILGFLMKRTLSTVARTSLGAFVGAALLLGTPSVYGQCSGGGCGGNGDWRLEAAKKAIDKAESPVENGSLPAAYEAIQELDEKLKDLDVATLREIRTGLQDHVKTLQQRSDAAYKAAVKQYFEGDHESALEEFKALTQLKGLPAAKKSANEIRKEGDRAAWRQSRTDAIQQLKTADHIGARESLMNLKRLASRTGYRDQLKELTPELEKMLRPRVDSAAVAIERERYDQAYATLIEISRLNEIRGASLAARKLLQQHATNPDMSQAKAEYTAQEELNKIQAWIEEITHPSPKEWEVYQTTLDKIATSFKGTRAGEEAKRLFQERKSQQASY